MLLVFGTRGAEESTMAEVLSGRSPWLWLAAAIAMILALGFGIFADDDGFGDFESFTRSPAFENGGSSSSSGGSSDLQDAIDQIVGDALGGNFDLDDYQPPSFGVGSNREEIRVTDTTVVLDTLSIQDMLDSNGYGSTSVELDAEGGRKREGILLEDLLDKAGASDWNTVVLTDFGGQIASVTRETWEEDSEQYLLYWSGDTNPSPTLSFSVPGGPGRLVDVVQITVLD
jgi:hypothetical protein